ncbi:restriction endonuclease subunit S [Perlabentimonas gracilis]|uniref:restriction endonuclease subunit S n=1 Tax=Perlabentimonas gracilis TaxID=2715279 RepID=UPI001409FA13|nr:restriction endonuclease subunit S [Perlabentimonas gracilis]NHB69346.1 restriction endonuclease subunit S [Perlabentimonas gracilis]
MSHWKEYKLGEIAELRKEGFMPNSDMVFPYIGLEHIEPESLSLNGIGQSSDVTSQKFKFYPNDVLYGKLRPYFKKVYSPNFEGVCSTDIYVVKAKNGVNSKYLFYLFATDEFTQLANSGSTGTRMPRADWKHLSETLWNIPDLPTQTAIASILSSLDEKIELNNAINRNLEALAQALFKQWFVEFNFPVDDHGNFSPLSGEMSEGQRGYKDSGGELVERELGMMPKGWRVEKLNEVIEVKYGKDHKHLEDGDIPVYGSGGIMRYANKALYDKQSILIPRKGTLSNMFFINEPFWSVDTMFYTIIKTDYYSKYLFYTLKSFDLASMNVGSAVPSMTTKVLNDLNIIIPSDNIVRKFDEAINPIFDNKDAIIKENQSISTLRNTLLPKLISGELEVKGINTVSV